MSEEKKVQLSEAFYTQSDEEVLQKFDTTIEGLSDQEAKKG